MARRCENCAAWTFSDSVRGVCARTDDSDSRMAVQEGPHGFVGGLETRFNFGCVEWRTAKTALTKEPSNA